MTFSYSPYWPQCQPQSKTYHDYMASLLSMPLFTYEDGYITPVSDNEDNRVATDGLPMPTNQIDGYQTHNTYQFSMFERSDLSPPLSDGCISPYTSCRSSPGVQPEPWIESSASRIGKEDLFEQLAIPEPQSMAQSGLPVGTQHVDPRELVAGPGNMNAVVGSIGRSVLTPAKFRPKDIQKSKRTEKAVSAEPQETPWWCDKCNTSFTRSTNLRNHLERHNPHRVRYHCCHVCNKRFSRRGDMTRHIRSIHIGEPHSCKECHNTFPRRDILQRHEKIGCSKKKQYKRRDSKTTTLSK